MDHAAGDRAPAEVVGEPVAADAPAEVAVEAPAEPAAEVVAEGDAPAEVVAEGDAAAEVVAEGDAAAEVVAEGDASAEAPVAVPAEFEDFELNAALTASIKQMGWIRPTAVQVQTFKPLIAGCDVMVQSHTGSGKTGAFCIPWLAARHDPRPASETGVQLLVLLPTRELAKQVCDELGRLSTHTPIDLLPVYGGTAMQPQFSALRAGVHAVVGTPGRILDHIRRRSLDLSRVRTVILDECDEMLSMGFLEDIRAILDACTGPHQTCLFSATVPNDVQRIARRYMHEPVMITLSGDSVAAAEIEHAYYMVSGTLRTRDLIDILVAENPARAIIFCNTREETKLVANVLCREGYDAEALSSDLTQVAREKVMKAMREHKIRFLVATDVAARGIDISHVTHVINFSFPEQAENYVHRTGRTGRAGRRGLAISLIGPRDIGNFYYLKLQYSSIKVAERHLPPPEQLAAERLELKLDTISRQFPEQVSPEWVLLARGLMGDPRGERVIALLLERAMRAIPQRTPLLSDEDSAEYHNEPRIVGEAAPEVSPDGPPREFDRPREAPREFDRPREAPRDGERDLRDGRGRERDGGRRGGRDRDRRRDGRDPRDARGDRDRGGPGDRDRGRRRDGEFREERPPITASEPTPALPIEAEASEARPSADAPPITRDAAPVDAPIREAAEIDTAEIEGAEVEGSELEGAEVEGSEIEGSEGSEGAEGEAGEPGKRRRRRRRRGKRRPEGTAVEASEGAPADESEASDAGDAGDAGEIDTTEAEADAGPGAGNEEGGGRRRRRRRRSGPGARSGSPQPALPPPAKPIPRVSQDEIIIDIDEEELDVVRDHFGEVDELDELTVKGRRRAVMDALHEEMEIEDLSRRDAHGVAIANEAASDRAAAEEAREAAQADDRRSDDAPRDDDAEGERESNRVDASYDSGTFRALDGAPEAAQDVAESIELGDAGELTDSDGNESGEGNDNCDTDGESEDEADGEGEGEEGSESPKKRRRRRRRRKAAPIEMPDLTAPPHKDFWEVWAARFTFEDFEDSRFQPPPGAPVEEEPPPRAIEAPAPSRSAPAANASPEAPKAPLLQLGDLDDEDFVKIRLNLGRAQGQKAANLRHLLRERLGLEGRGIRDLTVRDASTLLRVPTSEYDRIVATLDGVVINGVELQVSRPESAKPDLRAPPPSQSDDDGDGRDSSDANDSSDASDASDGADTPDTAATDATDAPEVTATTSDDADTAATIEVVPETSPVTSEARGLDDAPPLVAGEAVAHDDPVS